MVSIFLIQLFWFTFLAIGSACVLAYKWVIDKRSLKKNKFLNFFESTHLVVALLLCLVIGLALFALIIVPSYFLCWPIQILIGGYLSILLLSIVILLFQRRRILSYAQQRLKPNPTNLLIFTTVLVFLIFDYIISLKVGAPLYGDAPVQLAKINLFMHSGFTLADPYYRYNGVVDPRYSTNLMNALQALCGSLLHTSATKVWTYSYAFYRLIIWLSIFSLSWIFLPKKYKFWSYFILALSPILLGNYFIYANLPDRIVLAWACLLIVGLKLWYQHKSATLLLIASLLVATTHALFSLICIGYLAIFIIVTVILRFYKLKQLAAPLLSIVILAVPVLVNAYYPNHTNQDSVAYNAGAISGTTPVVHKYGIFHIAQLPAVHIYTIVIYIVITLYFLLADKVSSKFIKLVIYILSAATILLWQDYYYLAIPGIIFLLSQLKSWKDRIAVGILVIYYGLIIYNPLFWHFDDGKIPPWVVARFSELNIFALILPLIGLLALTLFPIQRWKLNKRLLAVGGIFIVLILGYGIYSFQIPLNFIWSPYVNNQNVERRQSIAAIEKLSPLLKGQVIYSNDPDLSIRIPGVVLAGVVSFNAANESPMTNIARRSDCRILLAHTKNYVEFNNAHATVILTDGKYRKDIAHLARSTNFVKYETSYGDYNVYRIVKPALFSFLTSASVCSIPYGQ